MTPLETIGTILGGAALLSGILALGVWWESRRCSSGRIGSCQCFPPEQR